MLSCFESNVDYRWSKIQSEVNFKFVFNLVCKQGISLDKFYSSPKLKLIAALCFQKLSLDFINCFYATTTQYDFLATLQSTGKMFNHEGKMQFAQKKRHGSVDENAEAMGAELRRQLDTPTWGYGFDSPVTHLLTPPLLR